MICVIQRVSSCSVVADGELSASQGAGLLLLLGVADGDIRPDTTDDDLEYYVEDDAEFADLMDTFLHVMKNAHADGGLYVDVVVSKPSE